MDFGGMAKTVGKRVGGAVKAAEKEYVKNTGAENKESDSPGRKVGEKVGGYLSKKIFKTKAKGGPKRPVSQKGIF